jgi:hypothetical protein
MATNQSSAIAVSVPNSVPSWQGNPRVNKCVGGAMSLRDALTSIRISAVWTSLGGPPLRHSRGRAFWRNGDGYNVSLNDTKGVWHDHAHGGDGGILDLIQTVLQCDRAGAVAWLAETFNIPIEGQRTFTPQERKRYARARHEAERFLEWRDDELFRLREVRTYHLRLYHAAIHYILKHSLDDPSGCRMAELCEQHEAEYFQLDEQIDAFLAMSTDEQIALYQQQRRLRHMKSSGVSAW